MQLRPSDVFLKTDIAAILRALALTARAAPDSEYSRGFCAALAAVAVALNIAPDSVADTTQDATPFRY